MSRYKPSNPFVVPMKLLVPSTSKIQGVITKVYTTPDESALFYGSFRTFGGTESVENGLLTLTDTATIDTWYRPDIKADCRVYLCDSGDEYDIIGKPENIEQRNQYLQFKVKKVGGKA